MIDVGRFERAFRTVDDLVLRLKGLVLVRELLAERAVGADDLARHDEEIARVRAELARLVGGEGGGALGAAA